MFEGASVRWVGRLAYYAGNGMLLLESMLHAVVYGVLCSQTWGVRIVVILVEHGELWAEP